MPKTYKTYKISKLVCTNCNSKMYIPRILKRKDNHIKDLYCYKCKKVQKFLELGEYK